jgi:hypothetical protein
MHVFVPPKLCCIPSVYMHSCLLACIGLRDELSCVDREGGGEAECELEQQHEKAEEEAEAGVRSGGGTGIPYYYIDTQRADDDAPIRRTAAKSAEARDDDLKLPESVLCEADRLVFRDLQVSNNYRCPITDISIFLYWISHCAAGVSRSSESCCRRSLSATRSPRGPAPRGLPGHPAAGRHGGAGTGAEGGGGGWGARCSCDRRGRGGSWRYIEKK